MRMVGGKSSFWARLVRTDSNSRIRSRSTSDGAVAASMAAAGSSINRQAFAGDWLIHRASWSPQFLSACSSCSDSLIGGKCAKEHLSSDLSSSNLGCLDPTKRPLRTGKFIVFFQGVARLTKPNFSLQGLDNRYRAFKTPVDKQGLYRQNEKAKT
jgi:hypothetical protein